MSKEYLTITEIAKLAGISRQAIDKRLEARKVETIRFGRLRVVKADEVEKLTA